VNPLALDRVHGGSRTPAELDFSASLNPLGPPRQALDAYRACVEAVARYPDPYPERLRKALASWIGVDAASVHVTPGATAAFYQLVRLLAPRHPLVVLPTFSEIGNALLLELGSGGVRAIGLRPEDRWQLPLEKILGRLRAGVDAVFLGRPNNPTGTLVPREQVEALAGECERLGAWCVLDEAFVDFVGERESFAREAARGHALVVVRSLTKIFAIPGLRVGYLVAPVRIAEALRERQEPWAVCGAAEDVALACLGVGDDYLGRSRDLVARERTFLAEALGGLGFEVFPSSANFLLLRAEPAANLGAHLGQRGIAIRDLASLPGLAPGFYRVAVRDPVSNRRLIEALALRGGAGVRR
jgi:threonine-phosphate decarboxylase